MHQWAAHELLETNELLRKQTADIEFHAMCAEMSTDNQLKEMLQRQIRGMEDTYQKFVNILLDKGGNPNTGTAYRALPALPLMQQGLPQAMIPAPNREVKRLSDVTIATLVLYSHKAGSLFGMMAANESVDPDLRALHIMCANNCQLMAYETWQYMSARGFYEAPAMPRQTAETVMETFAPVAQEMFPVGRDTHVSPYANTRHLI